MNCHAVRQHWNLYHDSEGDAEQLFQISEHLEMCPDCAERFANQSRLERLLVDQIAAQRATPQLWNRVLAGAGLVRRPARRRWFAMVSVACGAAAAAAIVFFVRGNVAPAAPHDLAKLTAAWHERLVDGAETPQFRSGSDLDVEGYLHQRVSFPVRCPPRKDAGFAVQGAGVGLLAEQPAAYLAGRVEEAPTSIFILPRDGLAAFPHQRDALRKEKTHRCQEGQYAMVLGIVDQNAVLVVGQTDPDRLEQVLHAYGTYEDH